MEGRDPLFFNFSVFLLNFLLLLREIIAENTRMPHLPPTRIFYWLLWCFVFDLENSKWRWFRCQILGDSGADSRTGRRFHGRNKDLQGLYKTRPWNLRPVATICPWVWVSENSVRVSIWLRNSCEVFIFPYIWSWLACEQCLVCLFGCAEFDSSLTFSGRIGRHAHTVAMRWFSWTALPL